MNTPTFPETHPAPRTAFREAVAAVAANANAKLPACAGRIASAVKLVLAGDVELLSNGGARVASRSDANVVYRTVNGHCDCKDFARAPEGLCSHRLAYGIARRVSELLPLVPEVIEPWPDNDPEQEPDEPDPMRAPAPADPETPAAPVHGIDPRHIVHIQGKPFVRFCGLLDLAHKRGLQALKVDWSHNDAELSLAHAIAVFPFGTFEESGDATPTNVNRKVAPHFRRCALTRAAARALRLALGLDMVSVEELSEE